MRTCDNCKRTFEDDMKFCPYCGQPFHDYKEDVSKAFEELEENHDVDKTFLFDFKNEKVIEPQEMKAEKKVEPKTEPKIEPLSRVARNEKREEEKNNQILNKLLIGLVVLVVIVGAIGGGMLIKDMFLSEPPVNEETGKTPEDVQNAPEEVTPAPEVPVEPEKETEQPETPAAPEQSEDPQIENQPIEGAVEIQSMTIKKSESGVDIDLKISTSFKGDLYLYDNGKQIVGPLSFKKGKSRFEFSVNGNSDYTFEFKNKNGKVYSYPLTAQKIQEYLQ